MAFVTILAALAAPEGGGAHTGSVLPTNVVPGAHQPSIGGPAGPLNPHGFPPLGSARLSLADPTASARINIARGDLRPFTVVGLIANSGYSPGIFCGAEGSNLESRGGLSVSDVVGVPSTSNAPGNRMEAYNRALASDAKFRKITGCRASTACEERYRSSYSDRKTRDPSCPRQPAVLASVARKGTTNDLAVALSDFRDGLPASKDAISTAFAEAIGSGMIANAETLLQAGADINGRAANMQSGRWLASPLAAAFNTGDQRNRTMRATWLFDHGANFTNPGSAQPLSWVASEGNLPLVEFLIGHGASPNGSLTTGGSDTFSKADIQSGGVPSDTPFYAALKSVMLSRDRRMPSDRAWADKERGKALTVAIRLYEAGGRFIAGPLQDEIRTDAALDAASILLAAAARDGRLRDLISRWSESGFRMPSPDQAAGDKRFADYLAAVRRCPMIQPKPANDHIQLCADGSV